MRYRLGNYSLDTEKEVLLLTATQEIVSDNHRIAKALELLIHEHPKTLSKDVLVEKIWPKGNITEASLARLMSSIREILGQDGNDATYIKTVHGKGYRLELEPILVDENRSTEAKSEEKSREHAAVNPANLLDTLAPRKLMTGVKWTLVIVLLLVIQFLFLKYGMYNGSPSPPILSGALPGSTILVPLTSGWESTIDGGFQTSEEGLVLTPYHTSGDYFVRTHIADPGFLQGAVFSLQLEASPDYQGPDLKPYVQVIRESWPGEWDCNITQAELKQVNLRYDCVIDENAKWTRLGQEFTLLVGIKIAGEITRGYVKFKSASIKLLPSIFVGSGWRTTAGSPKYGQGVSYQPRSNENELSTVLDNPVNIKGSTLSFTIAMDDAFRATKSKLLLFHYGTNHEYSDCVVDTTTIRSSVFTYDCKLKYQHDAVVVGFGERIIIGIKPLGSVVDGTITVLGVTVKE